MLPPNDLVESLKLARPPWAHQGGEWSDSFDLTERLLLWEMGTGKTTTAVVWLRIKYRRAGKVAKTLILAPLATLPGWVREFKLNSPESVHSKVAIAAGTGKKKMPGPKRAALILKPESEIILTNHESLNMPEVLGAFKAKGFEAIVIDEIHRFKNHASKRFKNLLTFSDRATYRLGLTGTFILNSYMDIWAPCRFVDRGKRFGTNFYSHFRNVYFMDLNAGMPGHVYFPNFQPRPELNAAVTEKLSSLASRRTKKECLSLPERVITEIQIPLGPEQQRLYDEMEEDLIATIAPGEATASNALVKLLRMRQILCGFLPLENVEDPSDSIVKLLPDNPRMDALGDLLEDLCQGNKVVVWSTFRAIYPQLRKLAEGLGIGFAELHGGTKDRQAEIDRFVNDPECKIFFSNPAAGGTGVDGLQKVASYCIYYDSSHNLEHYLQSRDRIHRGGSEVHESITEIHLVADNTINVDISQALIRKENFAENVLGRLRSRYGQGRQTLES